MRKVAVQFYKFLIGTSESTGYSLPEKFESEGGIDGPFPKINLKTRIYFKIHLDIANLGVDFYLTVGREEALVRSVILGSFEEKFVDFSGNFGEIWGKSWNIFLECVPGMFGRVYSEKFWERI